MDNFFLQLIIKIHKLNYNLQREKQTTAIDSNNVRIFNKFPVQHISY